MAAWGKPRFTIQRAIQSGVAVLVDAQHNHHSSYYDAIFKITVIKILGSC